MKVLIACEFSGIVRDAFIRCGHDAWSCDLLPTERKGPHIQADVLDIIDDGWDLMIAHPPCTYLANSGNKHLYLDPDRFDKMHEAAVFFKALLNAPVDKICIENPIMRHAIERVGRRQDQVIQPWQFGHGETKATCLWLKNLSLLQPAKIVMERVPRVHHEPPSAERWKNRSRTLTGIADAFALQYGGWWL
jgi:hypothetical protein